MKGVSEIIVALLILVISIGLVGGFFIWSGSSTSGLKDTAEEKTDQETLDRNAAILIRNTTSGADSTVDVKNSGKVSLDSSRFTVYVNGGIESITSGNSGELLPGSIASLTIQKTLVKCDRVRVTGDRGTLDELRHADDGTCST